MVIGEDREELLGGPGALARGQSPRPTSRGQGQGGQARLPASPARAPSAPAWARSSTRPSPPSPPPSTRPASSSTPTSAPPLKELALRQGQARQAALLDHTTYAQPALFAIEIALFEALAEALGLAPDFLTGHSIGEIAAAHIAGVLSLPDAAKLVAARATPDGSAARGRGDGGDRGHRGERSPSRSQGKEAELSIAAINGPTSIVISGSRAGVEEIQRPLRGAGQEDQAPDRLPRLPLAPDGADARADFAEVAESLAYHEPKIPIVSNRTGEILTTEQATDPAYWVSHVREPVRFADGIATLDEQGVTTFLELGPDAVLTAMAGLLPARGPEATLIPTLREGARARGNRSRPRHRPTPPEQSSTGEGSTQGAKRVPLPTYPFQRERFWLSAAPAADRRSARRPGDRRHPLLGAAIEDPSGDGRSPSPAASPSPPTPGSPTTPSSTP